MTAQALVASARAYTGVRFRHRGRNRQGVDCAGLVWCAFKDIGLVMPDYRLYGREPNRGELERAMESALGSPVVTSPAKRADLQPGDVLVVRFKVEPHHVGIVTDYTYGGLGVIHADGHSNKVIEHRLADDMVSRITHVFRMSF